MQNNHDKSTRDPEARLAESRRILDRVNAEAETFLTRSTSTLPDEADDNPRMMFWARLVGRGFGIMFLIYLIVSLYIYFTG